MNLFNNPRVTKKTLCKNGARTHIEEAHDHAIGWHAFSWHAFSLEQLIPNDLTKQNPISRLD
jgi:hypothetical protein